MRNKSLLVISRWRKIWPENTFSKNWRKKKRERERDMKICLILNQQHGDTSLSTLCNLLEKIYSSLIIHNLSKNSKYERRLRSLIPFLVFLQVLLQVHYFCLQLVVVFPVPMQLSPIQLEDHITRKVLIINDIQKQSKGIFLLTKNEQQVMAVPFKYLSMSTITHHNFHYKNIELWKNKAIMQGEAPKVLTKYFFN